MKELLAAVSIICGDLINLENDIEILEKAGIDLIHFDVMDGQFVPGFGLSEKLLVRIRPLTKLPIEVHLMTLDPERHIDIFASAGADIISVHQETCPHLHRTLKKIKERNISAGVVINPATSLDTIRYVLDQIDIVTLMAIDPGLIGSDFIPFIKRKITDLVDLFEEEKLEKRPKIQIDGSLDKQLAKEVSELGCDIAIHGSNSFFARRQQGLEKSIHEVLS